MYNELNNHKKSDNVKWIATFVCIAILFVGVIAALIPTYTVRDEADPDVTINDTEMAGGAVIQEMETQSIKLMSARIPKSDYALYNVAPAAESAYTISATVEPADATNQVLTLDFDWVNPDSEWASGKAVGEYFAAVKTGDNTWSLSVGKAFGEQIAITVKAHNYVEGDTSEANLALKATCLVDYVKRVEKVTLSYNPTPMAFNSTTTISYDVTYSDGTIQGTFTAGRVSLKLTDYLFSACTTALTSGNYARSQEISNFADLTNAKSVTVPVGACTRFINATGDPGTGQSQWQSAFRRYVVSEPAQHAYLNMNWSYTYQGYGSDSGTAVAQVRFNADSLVVAVSSVEFDKTNIIM